MTLVISDKQQQNKIKELALPIFECVEKVLHQDNINQKHKTEIRNLIIELNKTMFKAPNNIPTWSIAEMHKLLNKLICVVPLNDSEKMLFSAFKEYLGTIYKSTESVIEPVKSQQNWLQKILNKLFFDTSKEQRR